MKRVIKVIVIILLLLFSYFLFIKSIDVPCLLKKIFHISCPMCGLTRSIKAILDGNIMLSLHYNIFGIIIFVFLILNIILLLYDVIFNKHKIEWLYNILGRYYVFLICLFIFNMILNNIRGI